MYHSTHSMGQECQEFHPAGIKKCGKRGKKGGRKKLGDSFEEGGEKWGKIRGNK